MTPGGGEKLARMRFAGKRPVGGLIVTEAPDVARWAEKHGFFTLTFDPSKAYDWRVVKALDVAVKTHLHRGQMVETCRAIFEADPASLRVGYGDGEYEVIHAAR